MKTRKVSISVFQILISIIVIIAIVLGIIAVKNLVPKKQNANKEQTTFLGKRNKWRCIQNIKSRGLNKIIIRYQ